MQISMYIICFRNLKFEIWLVKVRAHFIEMNIQSNDTHKCQIGWFFFYFFLFVCFFCSLKWILLPELLFFVCFVLRSWLLHSLYLPHIFFYSHCLVSVCFLSFRVCHSILLLYFTQLEMKRKKEEKNEKNVPNSGQVRRVMYAFVDFISWLHSFHSSLIPSLFLYFFFHSIWLPVDVSFWLIYFFLLKN